MALALLAPAVASAVNPGTFVPTGSMATARLGPAAAPLSGGRVLVVGGSNGPNISSAEIYDSSTGNFSATGSLGGGGVFGAAAAALPDGRVLLAGGKDQPGPTGILRTAMLFNPVSGIFTSAASMATRRNSLAAAPLPGGRVLVVGGNNVTDGNLASAEIYDAATDSFSPAGPMLVPRSGAAAASLPDGRVLVAGGSSTAGSFVATAEIYNPATNTFSSAGVGSMSVARRDAAAAPLFGGRVLITGGTPDGLGAFSSTEAFDPATNSFSPAGVGSLGIARRDAAAASVPDGRVVVVGGNDGTSDLTSTEVFGAPNDFTVALKGRKLVVTLSATGKVEVQGLRVKSRAAVATPARKKRGKKLAPQVKPANATGGPGTIEIPLRLTKSARKTLKEKGKIRLKLAVTFRPDNGRADSKLPVFKLKAKKKRK